MFFEIFNENPHYSTTAPKITNCHDLNFVFCRSNGCKSFSYTIALPFTFSSFQLNFVFVFLFFLLSPTFLKKVMTFFNSSVKKIETRQK